ncbi:MAG TPA: hypothetical protein VL225_18805, partial [Vicinamibacterales bacterium]|nr:hypothetical protein [Vicinamibacterales bacterium]
GMPKNGSIHASQPASSTTNRTRSILEAFLLFGAARTIHRQAELLTGAATARDHEQRTSAPAHTGTSGGMSGEGSIHTTVARHHAIGFQHMRNSDRVWDRAAFIGSRLKGPSWQAECS